MGGTLVGYELQLLAYRTSQVGTGLFWFIGRLSSGQSVGTKRKIIENALCQLNNVHKFHEIND